MLALPIASSCCPRLGSAPISSKPLNELRIPNSWHLGGNSKGSFYYIGCHGKPISFGNYVLKLACIFAIARITPVFFAAILVATPG
jgi:hypothetical protein